MCVREGYRCLPDVHEGFVVRGKAGLLIRTHDHFTPAREMG